MRITNLTDQVASVYTCNTYLIRGDWNRLEDVNTLIDVGNDPAVIDRIRATSTGVGKTAVEQVLLTHDHFDHAALLPAIKETFAPAVYAHSSSPGRGFPLEDGQLMRCGDREFEVIYSPGHSSDSICLYCETDGVLFAGDTPVVIRSSEGTYESDFISALERLAQKDVKTIYFGHGPPVMSGGRALLISSLDHIRRAQRAG